MSEAARYRLYYQREWQPYEQQICEPLSKLFGTPFEIVETGGNCRAIQATLENGDELLITDSRDILSPWTLRQKCWRNDREILGYMVGYYRAPDGHSSEALCYARFDRARDAQAVAIAVSAAMQLAAQVQAGQAPFGREIEL